MREYFDEDIKRMGEEYQRFCRALVQRGNGERIWRGENPLNPLPPAPAK